MNGKMGLRLQISKVTELADIGPKFSETVSANHLLSMIVKQTLELMSVEVCIIWLKDKNGDLIPRISFGLKTKLIQSIKVRRGSKAIKCIMAKDAPTNIYDLSKKTKFAIQRLAAREGLKSLLASPLTVADEKIGVLMICSKAPRKFQNIDLKIFHALTRQAALAITDIGLYDRMRGRVRKDYLNAIKTLAKVIDANDKYTRGHCDKVMKYSLRICRRLKLPGRDIGSIKTASLLHDIGKIGIDLSIIRKPGKLTEEDWVKVRLHPEIGAKIISQVGFLNDLVPIIRHHHERFAGGGYPEPEKKGSSIPIGSRIIAVADAYDAMTSERPYRRAMTKEGAIAELKRCSGTQFDPKVVNAFVSKNL